MSSHNGDRPTVEKFADHEIITPPHKLKAAINSSPRDPFAPDIDPVARAEVALAHLSGEFGDWMRAECDRLDAMRERVRQKGLVAAARQDLFRAAHDIKGQAAIYGFPLAAEAADSLCRLIEHTPDPARVPLALVDQHVDGVRAIIREDARAGGNRTAVALATGLRRVTDEFLTYENRARPGYLDGIVAPPLAPEN